MSAELSQLKQEVAELWTRYRKDEPVLVDDEGRKVLSELNRTLEGQRRALSDRSSTLRIELEVQRRRASRLSPVVRVIGGVIGSAVTAVLAGAVMPALAAWSMEFTPAQGSVLLAFSLLLVGLAVSRADHP